MTYKRLPKDEPIGPEEALYQAAVAFDAAGFKASQKSDVEGLLNVGAMWMKLSDQLLEYSKVVQDEEETPKGEMVKSETKIETGFCMPSTPDIIVEEDDNG